MLILPGGDRGPDRAAPVPRDPPRRHLAAVVEGGRRQRPAAARRPLAERVAAGRHGLAAARVARAEAATVASDRIAERQQRLQAVQGGRQGAREAVLPLRDAPRHDHVARRRGRDHRARGRLEVVDPRQPRRAPSRAGSGSSTTIPADPGTFNFVPRPDWYFYFLFYLLRIFKWPDSVILGTVGIPTILLILLIALPFIDVRAERHPLRRPVAMVAAVLVDPLDGDPHLEGRDREGGARLGDRRHAGAGLGEEAGLRRTTRRRSPARGSSRPSAALNCHTYLGDGEPQPRRAGPERGGREEQGDPLPDRPPRSARPA